MHTYIYIYTSLSLSLSLCVFLLLPQSRFEDVPSLRLQLAGCDVHTGNPSRLLARPALTWCGTQCGLL